MRNIRKIFVSVILVFILLFSSFSQADVGDFESYDSSWDSDWSSSSSWDSDWGSDWSSSSSYSDWGYGPSYGYSSYDGGGMSIVFFIFVIFVFVILQKAKSGNNTMYRETTNHDTRRNNNYQGAGYVRSQVRSEAVADNVRKVDKHFNDEQFLAMVKNLFVKLQTAWSERNWETIRPLESEALFEQHEKQLKGYIDRKQINKIERICVNFAELVSFAQDNEKDILVVALNSSMTDYIIDEESGKVLKGSKDHRVTNTYKLTFIRKKGIVTEEGTDEKKTTNCPNCGAPTTITSSGKCEFCGSVITIGAHDWVLGDMERM